MIWCFECELHAAVSAVSFSLQAPRSEWPPLAGAWGKGYPRCMQLKKQGDIVRSYIRKCIECERC